VEVKPGYKQTEVGVIPEDWDVFSMSELTEPQRPISYGIVQTGPNVANGVRCLRVLDIHEGRINKNELITTSKEISDSYRRTVLKAGDLVMPLRGKVGDVGLVDEELEGANLTRGVALIAIRSGWSPVFCQQVISSAFTRRRLEQAMNGSALQEIPIASLRLFKIPTPKTLSEQRAIATALSDVDGLLGGLDRLIAKKRDLKQAAMQQLLTGSTRLPGFHSEWEVKRLGDAGKCLRGVSYKGDSDLSTHDTPHTKRLLRSNNVQNAIVVTHEVQFVNAARVTAHQILKKDDILICMANGSKALVGKAGIFMVSDGHEYTFGAFMGCFRTNSAEANPAFVFYLFLTGLYRNYINNLLAGSSINNLRPSSIESLEFPVPKVPEQTAIAEVLSDMDVELAALEQRREKTRALKQAMMQELLIGRTRLI
jgi:type I restriction enzyme, S subunit